ncbi:MAG: hypothetical protein DRN91_06395, partial [Candidatus Alkanophagales archaeon]
MAEERLQNSMNIGENRTPKQRMRASLKLFNVATRHKKSAGVRGMVKIIKYGESISASHVS